MSNFEVVLVKKSTITSLHDDWHEEETVYSEIFYEKKLTSSNTDIVLEIFIKRKIKQNICVNKPFRLIITCQRRVLFVIIVKSEQDS